jgi:hypothetical protein
MNRITWLLFVLMLGTGLYSEAQVKIGGNPGSPHPRAVLQLVDTAKGFLLPTLSQTQMTAIATPPDGLLVYNQTQRAIYQYKEVGSQWKPIVADSSEWAYDSASAKLYFRRGVANEDSIYYHTAKKKFLFADTRFYRLSSGGIFNLDEGNSDKYVFKVTASRFYRDPVNLNSAAIYSIYEVDNDTIALSHPFEASYNGMGVDATVNQLATQKIGALYGIRTFTTFAGQDSISIVTGLLNSTVTRGKGFAEVITGIQNSVTVRDSVTNVGLVYGINNTLGYSSPLGTPRIAFDLYGYYLNISSALTNKVDGSAYGVFLRNVTAAAVNKNFAIYTSRGVSRFGDSVLITENGVGFRPRAALDVSATSAMIVPVGTQAQRPAITYTGMLRYNTDLATPEAYTGTAWVGLKNPVIASSGLIDPPFITNNTTVTVNYGFAGAAIGNTVTISPASSLPSGLVIAWAYVSAPSQVSIGFANFSGVAMDPPAQTFYVKVVQ